jgi:predicted transcriptional regulator
MVGSKVKKLLFIFSLLMSTVVIGSRPDGCAVDKSCLVLETRMVNKNDLADCIWHAEDKFRISTKINGKAVTFAKKLYVRNNVRYEIAIINTKKYLKEKNNTIILHHRIVGDKEAHDTIEEYIWYSPNSSKKNRLNRETISARAVSFTRTKTFDLRTLDPGHAGELNDEKSELIRRTKELIDQKDLIEQELPALNEEAQEVYDDFLQRLDVFQAIVEEIINLEDFDEITEEQLERLGERRQEVEVPLKELQTKVEVIRQNIEGQIEVSSKELDDMAQKVKKEFQDSEEAIKDIDIMGDINIDPIIVNPKPSGDFNPEENEYDNFADIVIDRLKEAIALEDNNEMDKIILSWIKGQEETEKLLKNGHASVLELKAFEEARQKVLKYLKEAKDSFGFKLNTKIPLSTRRTIGVNLKKRNKNIAENLVDELNSWDNKLTENQATSLVLIDKIGEEYERYDNYLPKNKQQEEVKKLGLIALDESLNKVEDVVKSHDDDTFAEKAEETSIYYSIAKELGMFLVDLTPVGTAKDGYEALFGSTIDGEKLSTGARTIAGVAFAIGAIPVIGGVLKKLFKGAVGVIKFIPRFFKVIKSLTKAGAQKGIKLLPYSDEMALFLEKFLNSARKLLSKVTPDSVKNYAKAITKIGSKNVDKVNKSLGKGTGVFGEMGAKTTREALDAGQMKNLTRFEKKLPAGAKETKIRDLGDGTKVFQAEVPGNVPGSKAIYEKTVNASGKTEKYLKTTYDNKGKIVHIKDKVEGGVVNPGDL